MTTSEVPVERSLFVRNATGLVRGWSSFDGFIYAFFACNVILGLLTLTYASFIPGGSVFWAIVITVAFVAFEVVVYAALVSVMPRAGGDYVWQTRIFNGPVGFVLAAAGWWFILWHWIPIYSSLTVAAFLNPVLRIIGADGVANWLVGKDGVFVSALAVIALTTAYVSLGMRGYAKFQRWTFYIGIVSLAIAAIALLVTSKAGFIDAFNSEARDQYGVTGDAYAATMKAGAPASTSALSGSFGDTLKLVPFLLFWLLWPNWGSTLAGEVRGARDFRKNIYAMGAALLAAAAFGFIFIGAISSSMGWDFFMASSATYWGGTGPVADYLSPVTLAAWTIGSPVIQVLLITGTAMIVIGWYGTVFLSSTRMIFAAAFDRVLPEKAAAVSRGGVPYVALALMVIPSIFVSALYAYTDGFATYTLDAVAVIAVTYLGTTLAAMVMPWRMKRVYQASPLASWRIGGIPVITIVSLVFAVFLALNLVWWLRDDIYGVNNKDSLIYMGILYALAIAIYSAAAVVRRRQGMGLETVTREIPVE